MGLSVLVLQTLCTYLMGDCNILVFTKQMKTYVWILIWIGKN